jgi:glycosyltransferase involved in cell wall biosynthesis
LNVYKVDEPLAYRISALSQIKIYGLRYNPFRNMRIRHYLSYVDKLFAVSDALKQALEENGIKYITVLHNGISVADWQTDSPHVSAFRTTHGLDGKKVILFGGRLSGAKGAVVALQVLKIVSEKVKDAVLLIVGSVDSKGAVSMKKQAEAIGLADKTIFTGWLAPEHMKDAMASSSVVAVLSVYLDPFPTINMEAMACRKPVVGTIFGGTPEIAIDRKTGYIVDPRDVSSVAEKMTDLLEDPKKAGRFGEAGYERVRSVFSMEAHIDALLACYNA